MPITRSGRFVAAASDVIGIEDVFDARIACGGSVASARRKSLAFAASSSTTASIIRAAVDEVVDGRDAREHLVGGSRRPSRPAARGSCRIVASAALDRAGIRVVQRHAPAGRGDDLRDAAAHLPRADDEDVLELHVRRLAVGLIAYPHHVERAICYARRACGRG